MYVHMYLWWSIYTSHDICMISALTCNADDMCDTEYGRIMSSVQDTPGAQDAQLTNTLLLIKSGDL